MNCHVVSRCTFNFIDSYISVHSWYYMYIYCFFVLAINECENDNGNCSHICTDTETSHYCSCKHGFKLLNDSKTCKGNNR